MANSCRYFDGTSVIERRYSLASNAPISCDLWSQLLTHWSTYCKAQKRCNKVTGRIQLEKVGVWLYFTHRGFKRCSVCDFSTRFDWPISSNLEKDRKCDQGPRVGEGAGFSLVRFLKSYNDKCSLKNKNSLKYQNMTFLFLPELQQSTFSSLSLVFMFDDLFYL